MSFFLFSLFFVIAATDIFMVHPAGRGIDGQTDKSFHFYPLGTKP